MTKQQQIDTLQEKLDAANEQIATIDNALKEQYLSIATNIISEIKCWFRDQSEISRVTSYDDIYKYLDNLRNVIEATAPKYTPSVLCELSMALSETRRIIAEQRIQINAQARTIKSLMIRRTKDALNAVYGAKSVTWAKQEDNNEDTRTL